MPRIEVRGIHKTIGKTEVLSGISLDVGKGECFGILGENGSGKTTLLRIMTGLVAPTSGHVAIGGSSPHTDPEAALGLVGALIGIPAFYPHMSAWQNLRIFSETPDDNGMLASLEDVGLVDEKEKKVGAYSRGMLQRLGIALALMHPKPFILLDEPTQGVDEVWVERLTALFKVRIEAGSSFIIASHDFDFVTALCSSVLILDSGKTAYQGRLKDIAEFPYFFRLACSPRDTAEKVIGELPFIHKKVKAGDAYELILKKEMAPEMVDALVAAGCKIHECAMIHYSIADLVRQRNGRTGNS